MKQRQLIGLGAALVVLLGVSYLTGVFRSDISTVDVPDVDVPVDQVHTIRAEGAELDVSLTKDVDAWRLTEPIRSRADSVTVARVLEHLSTMGLQSVVTTNPDRYDRYGVDSAATTVTLEWDGGQWTVTIGDAGPGVGTTFVRLGDREPVYLSDGVVRIPENLDDWRHKTMLEIPSENVARVSVEGPDRSYVLERQDGAWMLEDDEQRMPVDSAAAARYLDRFGLVRADGFLASAPPSSDSTYTVRLDLHSGAERVLSLVPADGDYAATVDEDDTVYRLNGFRFSQYVPESSTFTRE